MSKITKEIIHRRKQEENKHTFPFSKETVFLIENPTKISSEDK